MTERTQITFEQARFVKPAIEAIPVPVTLAEIINGGVELTNEERRSVLAADAMTIGIDTKGILVGADIFMRNGIFRAAEVLGFEYDQSVNARDKVRTEPEYEVPWIQFNLLREEGMAEVAIYKRTGRSNDQIAEVLGIEIEKVDSIISKLDEYGVFGGKKSHEVKHVYLRDQVARIDGEMQEFELRPLSVGELGKRLDTSPATLSRLRVENGNTGRPSTLGEEGRSRRREEIVAVILANQKLSNRQISELFLQSNQRIKPTMVRDVRRSLADQGLVELRRKSTGVGETKESIRERRESLGLIIDQAIAMLSENGKSITVASVRKFPGLENIPETTLRDWIKLKI